MIKDELKKRHITLKQIQRSSNIPYTTLNDIVNGRTSIDTVGVRVLVAFADALGISLDETYSLFKKNQLSEDCMIEIKGKTYYLKYRGKAYKLCAVNEENTFYIREIAESTYEEIRSNEEMLAWH